MARRATEYAFRLGNQGKHEAAHAMTIIALMAFQSFDMEHLRHKIMTTAYDAPPAHFDKNYLKKLRHAG